MLALRSKSKSKTKQPRITSDNAVLSFDLLSNLTYMAGLAVSMTSRDRIFQLSQHQSFQTAVYFRQVYQMTRNLGFEYARAFQLVAKRAGASTVKALLLRFASSMSSGESELGFLMQEARVEREVYTSTYYRQVENLQKWSDAYAALLVSVSVIVVVSMVSTMLVAIGPSFVVLLSGTTIMINLMGSWLIYKAAPHEVTAYRSGPGPLFRRWALRLWRVLTPVGLGIVALALLRGWDLGWAFLVMGIAWLPTAVLAMLDDGRVNKLDSNVASFVRALGNVAGALGSTLTHALTKVDRRSMGPLEPYIQRLQARLNSRLSPAVCWERFRDETGSELINRTTRILVDGVELGGSADRVGEIAGDYAMGIALLRAKRQATGATFAYMAFPLHAAMVGLLVFILEVMKIFNFKVSEITTSLVENATAAAGSFDIPSLPGFQAQDLTITAFLTLAVVATLTVASSLASQFATGGHPIKIVSYASFMSIITGAALLFIPPVAQTILQK